MPKSSGAWVRMPSWIERAGIDQAFARRAADEGAVIDAAFLVGPGILMRIELDERQRAVDGGMGAAEAAA